MVTGKNEEKIKRYLEESQRRSDEDLTKQITYMTKNAPSVDIEKKPSLIFLGQCPAIAQLRGGLFNDYKLSIKEIFDNFNNSSFINFTNKTNRFLDPEIRNFPPLARFYLPLYRDRQNNFRCKIEKKEKKKDYKT